MKITTGDAAVAVDIMREAASWLANSGKPLWPLEDITEEKILAGITRDNVCVGWVGNESAAAMILQWEDPLFWPDAHADSGFIHKLCIRRRFAGTGISGEMIEWAKRETRRRGRAYLRLDCAADRPKLCAIYERLGFEQKDRRLLAGFDTAFYELRLT